MVRILLVGNDRTASFDVTVDFPRIKVAVGQACGDNLIEAKRWLLAHEIPPEEFALLP